MLPIILVNLALIVFLVIFFKKKFSVDNTGSLLKHMGLLEAAWTIFLFTLGLFILFDIMEAKQNDETFLAIATEESMILLSLLFGFGIIHLAICVAIVVKLLNKRTVN